MGKVYTSIWETIGNTPLVKLSSFSSETGAVLLAKLESFNPLSSIKDRVAFAMILDAEEKGLLEKGGCVVEPTSGNTGIGLAYICAARGYRLILVMPESMSSERQNLLKALGAELILTPSGSGMGGAIDKAREIASDIEHAFYPGQFSNPANPGVHRQTTAPEIWEDTGGDIDIFVAGIGTGGTITGVGEFLKDKDPSIEVIGVEPERSAVISGRPAGAHNIQGIGAGFIPDILNTCIIDEIFLADDGGAAAMSREIARREGIFCGISSGAALQGAMKAASRPENEGKVIVTVFPDSGERYLSTGLFG